MPQYESDNEIAQKVRSSTDAFGRARTASPYRMFDSKNILDNQPNIWDDVQVSGTATSTLNTNRASVTLAVTNAAVGRRVRQSKYRIPYQPGKSQQIMMTGVMHDPVAGSIKRLGLFDDNNGVFFQVDANGINVVIRSSASGAPVDTIVNQSDWNVNRLNGRQRSIVRLDLTKAQIFAIDFEWLGVGIVRFGFVLDGILKYAHIYYNANTLSSVYMSTPNLPVRYEIVSTSQVNDSLECICAVVNSEGGNEIAGWPYSVSRKLVPFVTLNNAALYPVLSIRLKATRLSARIMLEGFSIYADTTSPFSWFFILNPTIVGTALAFTDVNPRSSIEAAVGTTNATTITENANSVPILAGYDNQANTTAALYQNKQLDFILGSFFNGTPDVLCLVISRLSAQAETYYASINYREII